MSRALQDAFHDSVAEVIGYMPETFEMPDHALRKRRELQGLGRNEMPSETEKAEDGSGEWDERGSFEGEREIEEERDDESRRLDLLLQEIDHGMAQEVHHANPPES